MTETLEQRLAALSATYAGKLAERVAALEEAAARLAGPGAETDPMPLLGDLRALAHRLAGTGATFGFPAVSEIAREIENLCDACLAGSRRPNTKENIRLETLLESLKNAVPKIGGNKTVG